MRQYLPQTQNPRKLVLLGVNQGNQTVIDVMNVIKNKLRTLLGIRVERELLPAGPKPQIGSNIVRDKLRIRLKYPISDEQWEWFTTKGWRTVDMRSNRRSYVNVPDKVLLKILHSDELECEVLHARLVKTATKRVAKRKPITMVTLQRHSVINTVPSGMQ